MILPCPVPCSRVPSRCSIPLRAVPVAVDRRRPLNRRNRRAYTRRSPSFFFFQSRPALPPSPSPLGGVATREFAKPKRAGVRAALDSRASHPIQSRPDLSAPSGGPDNSFVRAAQQQEASPFRRPLAIGPSLVMRTSLTRLRPLRVPDKQVVRATPRSNNQSRPTVRVPSRSFTLAQSSGRGPG